MGSKIKYRPLKESLNESIKAIKEFNTVEEMYEYIAQDWQGYIKTEDLSLSDPLTIIDARIGWKNFRYVLTAAIGNQRYMNKQVIGYCELEKDGKLKSCFTFMDPNTLT